jgi:hypothetical protein
MLEVRGAGQGFAGAKARHVFGACHVDAPAVNQLAALGRQQIDAGPGDSHDQDQDKELTHAEADPRKSEDRIQVLRASCRL